MKIAAGYRTVSPLKGFQHKKMIENQNITTIKRPGNFLFFLLLFVFTGALLGSLLVTLLGGMELQSNLLQANYPSSIAERNGLRGIQLLGHLCTFTVSSLAFAFFFFGKNWVHALGFRRITRLYLVIAGIGFLLFSFPLAQMLLSWNARFPLPDWAMQAENSTSALLQQLLQMDQVSELAFNFLLIAIAPALGEELLFRGLLQSYLQRILGKAWLAIWITAIVFSFFHFQLAGFLPRMLLGACLGYLFFWTANLWIPIAAHLVINGMQVILPWFYPEMIELAASENTSPPHWGFTIVSTIFMGVTGWWLHQNSKIQNTAHVQQS